jgi:hypothetical protein|tara:strand:+ start:789 stop:1052 length:264 start_codon:yes stop_codon:yes gene_type:complete
MKQKSTINGIATCILSWLPIQDCDINYPNKKVIILQINETGYFMTDWEMTKETIISRNKTGGFNETDRLNAEHFACFGYELKTKDIK